MSSKDLVYLIDLCIKIDEHRVLRSRTIFENSARVGTTSRAAFFFSVTGTFHEVYRGLPSMPEQDESNEEHRREFGEEEEKNTRNCQRWRKSYSTSFPLVWLTFRTTGYLKCKFKPVSSSRCKFRHSSAYLRPSVWMKENSSFVSSNGKLHLVV